MKLLKPFLAAGLLAASLAPLSVVAADTQAQSLAREALEKKLRELQSPQAPQVLDTNAIAPATTPVPTIPPSPAPDQVAPPPPPPDRVNDPNRVGPAIPPSTVRQAQPPPAPTVAPVVPPPQPTVAPVVAPPPPKVTYAPIGVDSAEATKAREALRVKMSELQSTSPVQPVAVQPTTPMPPGTPRKAPQTELAFPPIQGPANPLSASTQSQLDTLLARYRADEITPQQYHDARAKILTGK